MKTVILAGGYGTRLGEATESLPKPMVQIGGKPILWHIMKYYGHHDINDFVVCLGYRGHVIKEFFFNYFMHTRDIRVDLARRAVEPIGEASIEPWKVSLIDTGVDTMTAGRLWRIRDHVRDGTFCMTYGDGLGDVDIKKLIAFHKSHGKLATLTTVAPLARYGSIKLEGDHISGFREKPAGGDGWINGGFFVLEPKALAYAEGDDSLTWERTPIERLARDGQLMGFRHGGFWQAMDTMREKALLEDLWSSGRAPWKLWRQ